MRSNNRRVGRRQGGFSLLEMMVAVSILAMTLGALYQATSGATRNVRSSERYAYGVELARSLLADNAVVPKGGVDTAGETSSGYNWRVLTRQRDADRRGTGRTQLHDLEVSVSWFDGSKRRQIVLNSVVEGAYSERRR